MLKGIKIIGIWTICLFSLVSCRQQPKEQARMVYKELSQKESYLLALTDNDVVMYEIYDLPTDTGTEIELTYEVYNKGQKIKEDTITSLINDQAEVDSKLRTIGLNIQDDKIRFVIGEDAGYSRGEYTLEENLKQYARGWYSNEINLTLGDEVYIYHAQSGNVFNTIELGIPIDEEKLNKALKENETNIFIKIAYKAL